MFTLSSERLFHHYYCCRKREEEDVDLDMDAGRISSYVEGIYSQTPYSAGGRRLMLEVKEEPELNDVKILLGIRASF
jgi:hypothetical protein